VGVVKEGKGTLIGNAGEYFVVAELLARGVVAALAPRNAPSFDVLATKGDKTVRIRVKTGNHRNNPTWLWVVKKDGSVFRDVAKKGDFVVLVDLAPTDDPNARNEYYIVPTKEVERWLEKEFEEWLKTPGRGGKPHNPNNPVRGLSFSKWEKELQKYKNDWDILWQD